VPNIFWDNAVSFSTYLMNRTPTQVNDFKTPLQAFSEKITLTSVLNLALKIFGCTVYVHIQKNLRTKLESRAEKCVFLGMGHNKKGYKCFNPSTKKFYTSMDVTFFEHKYFFKTLQNPIQEESVQQELNFNFLTYEHLSMSSNQ
jgi:hypothetical protein